MLEARGRLVFGLPPLDKSALVQKIIARLTSELEATLKSARSAHAEATDEQNKAENKYDTRGLEASYLAEGQSRQAAESAEAIAQFTNLELRAFSAKDPIDLGAVVAVESNGERFDYFFGPRAGGTEVTHAKQTFLVITPQSPLGQQLVGKLAGERWKAKQGGALRDYRIISVE